MIFQEGTVVTTQINHPPVTLSGVCTDGLGLLDPRIVLRPPQDGPILGFNFGSIFDSFFL